MGGKDLKTFFLKLSLIYVEATFFMYYIVKNIIFFSLHSTVYPWKERDFLVNTIRH